MTQPALISTSPSSAMRTVAPGTGRPTVPILNASGLLRVAAAAVSVVLKTLCLYAIMITGSIWEKVVFDKWLFARPFYWEDVFSMLVIALHTAYLAALLFGLLGPRGQMYLALAAYATYVINATQFLLKLRSGRLEEERRARQEQAVQAAGVVE